MSATVDQRSESRNALAALILIGCSLFVWASASLASHTPQLPPSPMSYVFDESGVFQPHTLQTLHRLLIEHERATSEQIVIAVFRSLQEQELVTWTNTIFKKWQLGHKGKDNGILVALYWKEHQVRIEVGYGLEPLLTDAQAKRILTETLTPALKAGQFDAALVQTSLAILRTLKSPLIADGRALQILQSSGLNPTTRSAPPPANRGILIGFFIFLILLIKFLSRFFSSVPSSFNRGWRNRSPDSFGGGWGGGGWNNNSGGDNDRFSGGGGSSGGGGANSNW